MEIRPLLENEYKGYPFTAEYTASHYYDIEILEKGFQLILKEFPSPVQKCFSDTLFSEWLEAPVAYGAFEGERLLGFVEGSRETWHKLFRVSNLFVFPENRKHGLGEMLLRHMVDTAKAENLYRGAILETQTCNCAAISLYEKLGFQLCRIDTHEYTNHDLEKRECRIDLLLPFTNTEKA